MLGSLYQCIGDDAREEPLVKEATELTKKTLGENSYNYASGLSDVASLYEQRKDFARMMFSVNK